MSMPSSGMIGKAASGLSNGVKFRKTFKKEGPLINWFPGHMVSGLKAMEQKLPQTDCVIEVHDSRIPLSGRNVNLTQSFGKARPHILLLNKKDLCDTRFVPQVEQELKGQGIDSIFWTELGKDRSSGFSRVLPAVLKAVRKNDRFNRSDCPDINVMVIGIPNVGKSCLINKVRQVNHKAGTPAKVGAIAGVTRHVMEKIKWCEDPKVYVLDTPGISMPKIKDLETYMKLAICSSLSDEVVGIELIADYGLYFLNKHSNFSYLKYFDLRVEPMDSVTELLFRIAVQNNLKIKVRDLKEKKTIERPDLRSAAGLFVRGFRTGAYGRIMMDYMDLSGKHRYTGHINSRNDEVLPFTIDVARHEL